MTGHCLILAGMKGFKNDLEFLKKTARLPVEDKYTVKFSITGLFKFDRKRIKLFNGRIKKMQMWS